ncbi:MAG: PAS domain S-box protein, partial [Burkholderiales bacterium]|nr:PAS domain S-box protein [Burkholderiales bacterium]
MRQAPSMPTLSGIDLITLFDAVADSVYLIDPITSGIVWCNRIAHESLGYQAAEILGHSVLSLQKDVTGLPAWQQIADEIRKTNPYVFLGRHRHKQGHEVSVEVLTRTFDMGGQSWFLSVARDITQRMALEADQLSRDEHVQFALNEASDGIWDWHLPTGEVTFSPQLKRMLGYGPHEMPPTVETWSTAVHPDDADGVFLAINQHLQGLRERYQADYRLKNRNGHYLWVHDRGRVCQRDSAGQPVRMVGMVQNITDQKALEQQLMRQASHDALTGLRNRHESEHTFESLTHTCKRLGVPLGVCIFDLDHFKQINDLQGHLAGDVVLTRVAATVAASVRASDSLFRWGGEEFLLLCPGIGLVQLTQLANKLRKEIEALTWPELQGLQAVTASFGLSVMPEGGQTPRELTLAADTALYQAKAAGRNCVVAHGQVLRTMDSPDAAQPRVVTLAAAAAVPDVHPTELLAEIQRLTRRERQLAQLLYSALDAVIAMDAQGCITEWNPGAERLLGWTAREVLGCLLEDVVVPPEHRAGHRQGLQRFLRDRTPRMLSRRLEVEAMRKDGTRLPAELSVWPIDTGEEMSFGAFMRDITERKLAQASLEQTAERYRQVVENLGEGMGIIQNGVTVYVNPRAAQLLRRTPESMLGHSFLEWVHPGDQQVVADRHVRRQAGEAVPDRYELRCLTGDGEVRWMSTRASALVW